MVETLVRSQRGVSPKLEERYRTQMRALSGASRRLGCPPDLPKSLRLWRASQPPEIGALTLRRRAEQLFDPLLSKLDDDDRYDPSTQPALIRGASDVSDANSATTHHPTATLVAERLISDGGPSDSQRELLGLLYQTLVESGGWPTFQYVSALGWDELGSDPRDMYYALGEAGLVRPVVPRARPFELREDTIVSPSLLGLTFVEPAAEDLARFVDTVRYLGNRAVQWRPSNPAVPERLVVTSDDIGTALRLDRDDQGLRRLLVLLRDYAAAIWTGASGPGDSGSWSLTADVERARSFRDVSTLHGYLDTEAAVHRAHSAHLPDVIAGSPEALDIDCVPDDGVDFGTLPQPPVLEVTDEAADHALRASTSENMPAPISNQTIAALASAFQHGNGPTHSTIDLIWAQADAAGYLEPGNKLDRVLGGLRGLRDGRRATHGAHRLPPDHAKLADVASALASRLVAMGALDAAAVTEALGATNDGRSEHGESGQVRESVSLSAEPRVPAAADANKIVVDDPTKVMVVYGQDPQVARALFDWLRAIGLKPQEWEQLITASGEGSPFIGKVLEAAFAESQAVIVLFTPDEHTRLRGELSGDQADWRLQSRPNVLFEAGMAFATNPSRTVLVVVGSQELPSDLAGRHYVQLRSAENLRDLARRLERAGCPVDLSGSDWLHIDRFPTRGGIRAAPPEGS